MLMMIFFQPKNLNIIRCFFTSAILYDFNSNEEQKISARINKSLVYFSHVEFEDEHAIMQNYLEGNFMFFLFISFCVVVEES